MPRWGRTVILVDDYEKAERFYCDALGFEVVFDSGPATGQRYLHLGTHGVASIWLLKASGASTERVGSQTGGEPLGVIYVDDLDEAMTRLRDFGVAITDEIGSDSDSRYVHVPDPYGNDLVLVEMTSP